MCDVFLVQASTKIIYFMYIYLFTESNVQNYAREPPETKAGWRRCREWPTLHGESRRKGIDGRMKTALS